MSTLNPALCQGERTRKRSRRESDGDGKGGNQPERRSASNPRCFFPPPTFQKHAHRDNS
uniref:Uncharacterized protein n=1 Tax=Takifugu rubripes TaxID=31033 RepID=A0A3B5KHV5_TAKRU